MGKKGTSVIIPPLQNNDGSYRFTDFEKAEELNSYFASISTINETTFSLNIFISTTCHYHTQNIDTQIKQDWNGSCKLI